MLQHCVYLHFKPEIQDSDWTSVMEQLASLRKEVEGLIDFQYGANLDYEQKSANYTAGFIATFVDRQAHLEYEAHPDHIKAGNRLVEMCVGGHHGILVFDLQSGPL